MYRPDKIKTIENLDLLIIDERISLYERYTVERRDVEESVRLIKTAMQ